MPRVAAHGARQAAELGPHVLRHEPSKPASLAAPSGPRYRLEAAPDPILKALPTASATQRMSNGEKLSVNA